MAGNQLIEQVRQSVNILDIIGQDVRLVRRGGDYFGVCPFPDHQEKTPSFSVSPSKQMYYCFGCGRGGNVFTYLMEYRHLSFADALKDMAAVAGIQLPVFKSSYLVDALYDFHEQACSGFQEALRLNGAAQDFFFRERQISPQIAGEFRLGWGADILSLMASKYTSQVLNESGLFYSNNFSFVGKFADCPVFPLIDVSGRVVGFARRGTDPKYWNSPETRIFSKSNYLYGLYQAREHILKRQYAVVVEGQIDVLSMHQCGVKNTVAACGTAFTKSHAKMLATYCPRVVCIYDGDDAGRKALNRSFISLFSQGVDVYVARPPDGKDPDDICREGGRAAVKELLSSAQGWFSYMIPDSMTTEYRESVISFIRTQVEEFDFAADREKFVDIAAHKLKIPISRLEPRRRIQDAVYCQDSLGDYEQDMALLVAVASDKSLATDPFVASHTFQCEDHKNILKLLAQGVAEDSPAIYDGLDAKCARILTSVLSLKRGGKHGILSLEMFRAAKRQRDLELLVSQLQEVEGRGGDITPYIERFNQLREVQES